MSHLSCIGFAVSDRQGFADVIGRLAALAREDLPPTTAARHLRWTDESGASVAIHVDGHGSIDCVTPYFVVPEPARWHVRTGGPADDSDCAHCGGADCDILDSAGEMVTRATVQWLHYQPYRAWLAEQRDFACEVVAFADRCAVYATSQAFEAAQESWWPGIRSSDTLRGFAEECFLPEGMFGSQGDIGARATAMFSGRVVSVRSLVNTMTGAPFWHVRVCSLPGMIDVVTGRPEGIPAAGSIAVVRGWLVGRPTVPPSHLPGAERLSWLKRLFTRRPYP
jgi:hypothetical protein